MRHCNFSKKQSHVNITRQSFVTRVMPENLLVTHDILSTTATFSSLVWPWAQTARWKYFAQVFIRN